MVLNKITLSIYPRQINVIIGPSGCGKSTLLNIIAGLGIDFKGSIKGVDQCKLSYVFQDYYLIGWKNVEKNILYSLSGKVNRQTLLEYGKALGLSNYWSYYPNQLSGGLRQRVNLLRAFINPASALLMDEPFKSLDVQSKQEAINLFLRAQRERGLTVILVTHSLEEAVELGNYIHILSSKPTKKLDTFINPYFGQKKHSIEAKTLFLNKIKEMIQ